MEPNSERRSFIYCNIHSWHYTSMGDKTAINFSKYQKMSLRNVIRIVRKVTRGKVVTVKILLKIGCSQALALIIFKENFNDNKTIKRNFNNNKIIKINCLTTK